VHYDKPPPTGGDYGVIFAADNMIVTPLLLPGDLNQNGAVEAADYVMWRALDGTDAEYNRWRIHFGEPTAAGAASVSSFQAGVPEPATLVLVLIAAAGHCRRATSRRDR